jgi:glycosyltransferase involved in cell wall biosynthesis
MENSPKDLLLEILLVDDASNPPASDEVSKLNMPLIRVIRNEERQGLIRAKSIGAHEAKGDILIYLDAHIRAYPGWMEPLVKLVEENEKRIAVPLIPVLNETTWEQISNYVGIKMLFDWKMDFQWLKDDGDNRAPIMSGGLFAINRNWFFESGEYDMGMLQWGGENFEQSVRTWLCGGEIIVARESRVGHMFRDVSPYVLNTTQIHVNKARAIDVWFDDYKNYYYRANDIDLPRRSSYESLASRHELRKRLKCKPFQYFFDQFKDLFIKYDLWPTEVFHIQDVNTGMCLTARPGEGRGILVQTACNKSEASQIFIPDSWNRIRSGRYTSDCLSLYSGQVRLGKCSAHKPEQRNWEFVDATTPDVSPTNSRYWLKKSPKEGHTDEPVCVSIYNGTSSLTGECQDGLSARFQKIFVGEYNHTLYK